MAAPLAYTQTTTSPSWEDLRKNARQLENELDLKLVSFSKLGTSLGSSTVKAASLEVPLTSDSAPQETETVKRSGASFIYNVGDYEWNRQRSPDSVPLLSGEHMIETMALEIEQLLTKLEKVNGVLSDLGNSSSAAATTLHTVQRHRDILQDYRSEFDKTRKNIQARQERENLLGSVRKDIDAYRNSSGLNRRSDLYLKEHEHLRSSERLLDEQINIAMETKEHLSGQRETFKMMQTKLNDLANRFPVINSLMQRINIRKRRDSIIIGCVIGVCLILMLWYAFR